jgi:ABC-type enterochelin transport system permease subunit
MKAFTDFIIAIADLCKMSVADWLGVEVAKAKQGLLRLVWAVAMVMVAGLVLVGAIGLLVAALFQIFYAHLGGAWAAFICGMICLGVVIILGGVAHCMSRR